MSPPRQDVKVVGRSFGEEDQRLRDFLTRAAQPFEWVEAESEEGVRLVAELGIDPRDLPR